MQGPELGVQADDLDLVEPEHEPQQEVIENKDVRLVYFLLKQVFYCFVGQHLLNPL